MSVINPVAGLPNRHFRLMQKFGDRPEYYKKYGHKGHNGYDIAPFIRGQKGVPIYAPHDGFVTIGDQGKIGYGKFVTITSEVYNKKGHRRQSHLAHLASFDVADSVWVNQGEQIGIMGTTGDSTGVHLHWTYKRLDVDKNIMDKDNGYNGAIDVGLNTLLWLPNRSLLN